MDIHKRELLDGDLHLPEGEEVHEMEREPATERLKDTRPLATGETDLESYLAELEKEAILQALEATQYNKTAAAEKLGISFRALRYRLKKLGLG